MQFEILYIYILISYFTVSFNSMAALQAGMKSASVKETLWSQTDRMWGQRALQKIKEQHCRNWWTYFLILNTLSLQGLYVFAVYFVMHNQLCWPTKASYTVEMSGHDSPDSTYQGGGPTTVGGDISKSTQNLISAMEEV